MGCCHNVEVRGHAKQSTSGLECTNRFPSELLVISKQRLQKDDKDQRGIEFGCLHFSLEPFGFVGSNVSWTGRATDTPLASAVYLFYDRRNVFKFFDHCHLGKTWWLSWLTPGPSGMHHHIHSGSSHVCLALS